MKNVNTSHEKRNWHEVALSEQGFYAPKRLTISPGLTIIEVRIWGPKPSKMSKIQKSFLNWPLFSESFWVNLEAKLNDHVDENPSKLHEN